MNSTIRIVSIGVTRSTRCFTNFSTRISKTKNLTKWNEPLFVSQICVFCLGGGSQKIATILKGQDSSWPGKG